MASLACTSELISMVYQNMSVSLSERCATTQMEKRRKLVVRIFEDTGNVYDCRRFMTAETDGLRCPMKHGKSNSKLLTTHITRCMTND